MHPLYIHCTLRSEIVHDHLMHCVPDGAQSTDQCVKGQTPDFPAGHYPNYTTGGMILTYYYHTNILLSC
jgi:hypothetical protein